MQKVNTFDAGFDGRKTADGRPADATGLGLAIRDVWARLLELSTSESAVGVPQEPDESHVAQDGLAILADYYDGAHDRVSAAEPVVSLRKLAP